MCSRRLRAAPSARPGRRSARRRRSRRRGAAPATGGWTCPSPSGRRGPWSCRRARRGRCRRARAHPPRSGNARRRSGARPCAPAAARRRAGRRWRAARRSSRIAREGGAPSCTMALRLPSARIGCAARISAVTKPVKSPTVLRPSRMRQPISTRTAATAMPAPVLEERIEAAACVDGLHLEPAHVVEGRRGARLQVVLEPVGLGHPRAARGSPRRGRPWRRPAPASSSRPAAASGRPAPIGWAANGVTTAATRVRTGSIQSIARTSAERVASSRRNTVDRRVSASRMNTKSVVKRCVRAAGLSRPSWARSASIRCP